MARRYKRKRVEGKPATKSDKFVDRTSLMPHIVAETVLMERGIDPYTPSSQWFIDHTDCYIRWLHANKADWKRKLEKSRDPRPFVYGFVNHWLDSYEKNPKRFKQRAEGVNLGCNTRK